MEFSYTKSPLLLQKGTGLLSFHFQFFFFSSLLKPKTTMPLIFWLNNRRARLDVCLSHFPSNADDPLFPLQNFPFIHFITGVFWIVVFLFFSQNLLPNPLGFLPSFVSIHCVFTFWGWKSDGFSPTLLFVASSTSSVSQQ